MQELKTGGQAGHKIHDWVHNSAKVIQSGDPYAVSLFNEFNKTQMTPFPQLSDKDIDAILDYVKSAAGKATASSFNNLKVLAAVHRR